MAPDPAWPGGYNGRLYLALSDTPMADVPSSRPEHSPLGKAVTYRATYAPELLFPISRDDKRREIGVDPQHLPFFGADLWNGYELSWLNPRGKPVVALATFVVPAESPRLIESKSFKLYLNSFNQTPFADAAAVRAVLERDISAAAGAPVAVTVAPLNERPARQAGYPAGILLDDLDVACDAYQPAPELLSADAGAAPVEETLVSHLLKSNCLVTGQPDWGTVVVRYRGAPIDRAGLLRYIVSFRNHNEFHEQCVERIYVDLMARCRPDYLSVHARYTRRGGLDINPWRASAPGEMPANLGEVRQ